MNASPFFIPFFLGEVTSFEYSIDAIVMLIYGRKQNSKLVKQFSINVTFIRMSALKKILKTTPFHQRALNNWVKDFTGKIECMRTSWLLKISIKADKSSSIAACVHVHSTTLSVCVCVCVYFLLNHSQQC